jgi:hypothetical protein
VEQLAELVVARQAELPGAEYIGRRQVHVLAVVRPREIPEAVWVVVQGDLARVGDPERVEQVCWLRHPIHELKSVLARDIGKLYLLQLSWRFTALVSLL